MHDKPQGHRVFPRPNCTVISHPSGDNRHRALKGGSGILNPVEPKPRRAALAWTAEGGCPYAKLFMPKAFYRRNLPHLQRDNKPHFLTFCTHLRWILPEPARDLALDCCLHDNDQKIRVHAVVVMPGHVHLIFTPLVDEEVSEVYSLCEIMDAIKGASAHKINRLLGRTGKVWQTESFDRVLRSSEKLDEKIQYILGQPCSQRSGVRVGGVSLALV